ncbi:MAG: hypothetical protein JNJ77_02010 [Planctomycetia bacterium]|nr:hypothetical protein [Planctomycetia bacterium]
MIKEYALEPSLLSNWDRFQRYISLFGVPNGRLISRFPKKWQLLVLENLTCGEVERHRIIEALARAAKSVLLSREQGMWQDASTWLTNVLSEHRRKPFEAILANSEVAGHSEVIDGNALDVTALPIPLRAGPSKIVVRTAVEMARSIRLLLQISKKIVIVDRNFSPDIMRFREPLREILNCFLDQYGRVRSVDIELHLSHRVLASATNFGIACQAHLENVIPEGMMLTIVRWNHEELHNRYILTDRGGVQLGEGLDEANERSSRNQDTLTLLSQNDSDALLNRYDSVRQNDKTKLIRIAGRLR